jgi:hypothetical protein
VRYCSGLLYRCTVSPEDSFLEAWETVFGEDFFEEVIPLVVSQITCVLECWFDIG